MPFHENPINVSGYDGLIEYNNTATDGYFGLFLLAAVFLVGFVSTGNQRKEVSFSFATFITLISGVLFSGMGLVGGHIIVILAVLTAASSAYLLMKPHL